MIPDTSWNILREYYNFEMNYIHSFIPWGGKQIREQKSKIGVYWKCLMHTTYCTRGIWMCEHNIDLIHFLTLSSLAAILNQWALVMSTPAAGIFAVRNLVRHPLNYMHYLQDFFFFVCLFVFFLSAVQQFLLQDQYYYLGRLTDDLQLERVNHIENLETLLWYRKQLQLFCFSAVYELGQKQGIYFFACEMRHRILMLAQWTKSQWPCIGLVSYHLLK